jgi:hypothetical protein
MTTITTSSFNSDPENEPFYVPALKEYADNKVFEG